MTPKTITFIGCGKLGKTLAYLLVKTGQLTLQDVMTRHIETAQAAVNFIGSGRAVTSYQQLQPADIYLIATGSDVITTVCNELATYPLLTSNTIVMHCSGYLSAAECLSAAASANAQIVSLHPIKSFADPKLSVETFTGTYCAIEGQPTAVNTITKLIQAIGGTVFNINPDAKMSYHAASVIASNYLVSLVHAAQQCYEKSGVSTDMSKTLVLSLMQGCFNNLNQLSCQQALTGPIQRGDIKTVQGHLNALAAYPDLQKIYVVLGEKALELAKLPQDKKQILEKILA